MKKIIFGFFIVLLAFIIPLGCKSQNKDTLKIGMELAYPPFEMTDAQGEPTGISVDFGKELGKYLGRETQIMNISWDGLIPALKSGKIDLIISSMTITEERKKSIDFSIPYSKAYLALLVNRNSNINSIADLDKPGKIVAVKKGTTGHIYVTENFKNAKINVFDKESACVLEVVQGKADAFIYDQMSIFRNWQNNKATTLPILKPFQKDFEYWGIAVRKGNTELLKKVNDFILWFKKQGGFDRLSEKYLSEEKKYFNQLGIPFFFSPDRE